MRAIYSSKSKATNAGLEIVAEHWVSPSPKPLPVTILLNKPSNLCPWRAFVWPWDLSCPQLGHALPFTPLTFTRTLWVPVAACPCQLSLSPEGRTVGFVGEGARPLSEVGLAQCRDRPLTC